MNSIQKKSLVIALILSLQQLLVVIYPNLLGWLLMTMLITIIATLRYFFKVKYVKKEIVESLKFLLLPVLFNFGGILYIQSLSVDIVRFAILVIFGIINYLLFVALRRVFNLEDRAAKTQRNLLVSVSILSIFFNLSVLFKLYITSSVDSKISLPLSAVVLITGGIFFLISYFLAWENGINQKKFLPYNIVIALLGMEIAWVSSIWIINYPIYVNFEKASLLGTPLPAVILSIIFYFSWGIVSHKAEKSLTKNVIIEYIVFTVLFLTILFVSAKWLPQI